MNYTSDWFNRAIPVWEKYLSPLKDKPVSALEIGSYEGRSAVWLLENILTHPEARITCIDPWLCPEFTPAHWSEVEERFDANLAEIGQAHKVTKLKGSSDIWLYTITTEFDFIYVDGAHTAKNILQDLVLCFDKLKVGSLLIIDDYQPAFPGVIRGVDAFLGCYEGCCQSMQEGKQVVLKKRRK